MNPVTIEDLMRGCSVDETAKIIGVCRVTLYTMMKNGVAPASYKAGRQRRFRLGAIRDWQAEQEAKAA